MAQNDAHCEEFLPGQKQLFWGDLHVHTAWSLDAYAFGNRRDPGDAFAFGRGEEITLADGITRVRLREPLDFMAVTDHAETFGVMYLCTDPRFLDDSYCRGLRSGSVRGKSIDVFRNYLLPMITGEKPSQSPLCTGDGQNCDAASRTQWRRIQEYANAANAPCRFTAFIGNEWSATPDDKHRHRNLIFSSGAVTREALDYIRYPDVDRLWQALDEQCLPGDGCDVLVVPHNTNLAEGGGFSIETADDASIERRMKYERLIEVFQSKGNSECLPPTSTDENADCGFEIYLPKHIEDHLRDRSLPVEKWNSLRASYARSLLQSGLRYWAAKRKNPLQLGFVGSTDNHSATPGFVEETDWRGDVWAWGDSATERLRRLQYNPGGLVGVWAEENTRSSIFAALSNREVYATSGPRIGLRFFATHPGDPDPCATTKPMRPWNTSDKPYRRGSKERPDLPYRRQPTTTPCSAWKSSGRR